MKHFFFFLLLTLFCIKSFSQKEIKPEEAKDHAGDTVKICTKIFNVMYNENVKGCATVLYTRADTANDLITFIIWSEKRKYFDYKPEKDLKEREVCVTGKIELLKEKPVMIVDKQSQIEIK